MSDPGPDSGGEKGEQAAGLFKTIIEGVKGLEVSNTPTNSPPGSTTVESDADDEMDDDDLSSRATLEKLNQGLDQLLSNHQAMAAKIEKQNADAAFLTSSLTAALAMLGYVLSENADAVGGKSIAVSYHELKGIIDGFVHNSEDDEIKAVWAEFESITKDPGQVGRDIQAVKNILDNELKAKAAAGLIDAGEEDSDAN